MTSPNTSSLRPVLRAGLLAGVVLDSALALGALLALIGLRPFGPLPSDVVSYLWLGAPALLGRAGIQALACYDRRRYDEAIPWLAATLVLSGLVGLATGISTPGLAATFGLIGSIQLAAWRRTR